MNHPTLEIIVLPADLIKLENQIYINLESIQNSTLDDFREMTVV